MEGTYNDNDRLVVIVVDNDDDDGIDSDNYHLISDDGGIDDDDDVLNSFATSFIENVLRGRRGSTIFLRRENTRAPIWKGAQW